MRDVANALAATMPNIDRALADAGPRYRHVDAIRKRTHNTLLLLNDSMEEAWERFEFGEVDYDAIADLRRDGVDMYAHAGPLMPFDRFVFTVTARNSMDDKPEPVRYVFACARDDMMSGGRHFSWVVTSALMNEGIAIAAPMMHLLADPGGEPFTGLAFTCELGDEFAITFRDLFFAMLYVLNTKGVEVTRQEVDAKLQASRAKHGKPPLKAVTYVNTQGWLAAAAEAASMRQKGTHLSPRPHLRRGHLHTYRGVVKWTEAMIINGRLGPIVSRDHYRVGVR